MIELENLASFRCCSQQAYSVTWRMAETGKPQTYNDVIEVLAAQCVILPSELLKQIDVAINANKQLGYATRAQFIEDAVLAKLQNLSGSTKQEDLIKASKNMKIGKH